MIATQKNVNIGEFEKAEAEVTAAFNKLTRGLKCRPGKRWYYDDVAKGAVIPCRRELNAIEECARAGASLEDLTAFGYQLVAFAEQRHAFYNGQTPSDIREALKVEAYADAPTHSAAAEVLCDPKNLAAVERLHEVTSLEIVKDRIVMETCRAILSRVR